MEHLSKIITGLVAVAFIGIAVLLRRTTWNKWIVAPLIILSILVSSTGIYYFTFSPEYTYAAVALDTSNSKAEGTCTTAGTGNTLSYTAAAGSVVVVAIAVGGGLAATAVRWNGNLMTQEVSHSSGGGDNAYLYSYYSAEGGTGDIEITVNSNAACTYGVTSFTGVDPIDPISVTETANASAASSITDNVTPLDDNSWTVDMALNSSLRSYTANNGQTIIASTSLAAESVGMVMGYRGPITPIALTADGYTTTSGTANNGLIIAVVRPTRIAVVRTDAVSAITASTAQANALIQANTANDITEYGFAWGTNASLLGGFDTATTTNGAFSANLGSAPTFVASSTNTASSATSLACNKPTGTAANNLLVAHTVNYLSDTATMVAPAGWRKIRGPDRVLTTDQIAAYTFYKVADGTEGSSFTFTNSISGYLECEISTYSGVDYAIPMNTATSGNSGTATTRTGTGITTSVDNSKLILHSAGFGGTPNSVPSGMTNRALWDGPMAVYDQTISTAGATGDKTHTQDVTSAWVTQMVAARPTATSTGAFTGSLTSLADLTTYYVRAYVTSTSGGTTYGSIVSFTTLCDPLDAEGCDQTFSSTGYQTWTAPADTTTANIACWGGGGGGGILSGGGGGGAGGGAYASSTASVSSGTVIRLFVGAGGATETAGATSTASTTAPAVIVLAASGGRALDLVAGLGGLASLSTGTDKNNGGNGGAGLTTDDTGGGGGGAGGPAGAGNAGTAGNATQGGAGGSGNAGSGGTAGTADTNGATTPGGGPGGDSVTGAGGGGGGDNGDPGGDGGVRGGGGGGGEVTGSGTEGGQGGNGACQIHYYGTVAAAGATGDHGIIWFMTSQRNTKVSPLALLINPRREDEGIIFS